MKDKKKVLAISGSTRSTSSNINLINAIAELFATILNIQVFKDIASLPHFNPDLDTDNPPATVASFRELIRESAGVIICTPEYAMGVPGTLKNALDWTVSSGEFAHKPTALITASTSGQKAHQSLLETLKVIEAKMEEGSSLIIPFIKTKVNDACKITDEKTLHEVTLLMNTFIKTIEDEA